MKRQSIYRYGDDFELWCRECVKVADKVSGAPVPFILNAPQRRVLSVLERQRRSKRPMRIIVLKARQWGCSTLVQVYMAWMQLVHKRAWHSAIVSHVKDSSANIRGMYSLLLRNYPDDLKLADTPQGENIVKQSAALKEWTLTAWEKSSNISFIPARDCRITLASSLSPDSLRGQALQMAHLSEVAFWGEGDMESASRIVRSVCGSVPRLPDTLIAMESTADGEDNYFYEEWLRAEAGESDKEPVFVPWHEVELYRKQLNTDGDRRAAMDSLGTYERALLEQGVSIEALAWYVEKKREYSTAEQMMAEYPSTPAEAFGASRGERLRVSDFL